MSTLNRPRIGAPLQHIPSWTPEIDWSNPLSFGLIGFYIPALGWNDIAGIGPTLTPQYNCNVGAPTPMGQASYGTYQYAGAYGAAPQYQSLIISQSSWFMAGQYGVAGSQGNSGCSVGLGPAANTPPYQYMGLGQSYGTRGACMAYPNGGECDWVLANPTGIKQTALATFYTPLNGNPTTGTVYHDGVLVNQVPTSRTDVMTWTAGVPYIFFSTFGGSDGWRCCGDNHVIGAMWNRALSPSEARQLANAPFSLLRPRRPRPIFFKPTAVTPPTIRPRITMISL